MADVLKFLAGTDLVVETYTFSSMETSGSEVEGKGKPGRVGASTNFHGWDFFWRLYHEMCHNYIYRKAYDLAYSGAKAEGLSDEEAAAAGKAAGDEANRQPSDPASPMEAKARSEVGANAPGSESATGPTKKDGTTGGTGGAPPAGGAGMK